MASPTHGVIVTDWLRNVLHPRRGGIPTGIRPLAGVDEAWAGLRGGVWAQDGAIRAVSNDGPSRVWQLVTSFDSGDREFGDRLLDPAPRIGGEREDHALIRAVRVRFRYEDHGADEWLADFLVATQGLPEACRRLLGAFQDELPYTGVGVFARLRQLLVAADESGYAEARDVLLDESDRLAKEINGGLRAHLFWVVTYLLPLGPQAGPLERAAHAKAMRHAGRFGNTAVHASVLAAGDLTTLERLLELNGEVRHEFFAGGIYLAGVLDVAGAAAGPVLARMRPFRDDPYLNGLWCGLLAHVEDDAARRVLDTHRRAGDTWATGLTEPETARVGVPQESPYQPPKAVWPAWLEGAAEIEPVLRFRDAEREVAERGGVDEDAERWDGVPIGRCDAAAVTAWLEHRERWQIPATLSALALAPRWAHERLMALGFTIESYRVRSLIPLLLVRHGVSHIAPLLAAFQDRASVELALEAAQPVGHASLAAPMAAAFAGKKHRRLARTWLLRHPEHAAAGAIAMWRADPDDAAEDPGLSDGRAAASAHGRRRRSGDNRGSRPFSGTPGVVRHRRGAPRGHRRRGPLDGRLPGGPRERAVRLLVGRRGAAGGRLVHAGGGPDRRRRGRPASGRARPAVGGWQRGGPRAGRPRRAAAPRDRRRPHRVEPARRTVPFPGLQEPCPGAHRGDRRPARAHPGRAGRPSAR